MIIGHIEIRIDLDSYPPFGKVLCADVDDGAANCLGGVEAKCVILVLLPQIEHPLGVDGTFINGARYGQVDELTG